VQHRLRLPHANLEPGLRPIRIAQTTSIVSAGSAELWPCRPRRPARPLSVDRAAGGCLGCGELAGQRRPTCASRCQAGVKTSYRKRCQPCPLILRARSRASAAMTPVQSTCMTGSCERCSRGHFPKARGIRVPTIEDCDRSFRACCWPLRCGLWTSLPAHWLQTCLTAVLLDCQGTACIACKRTMCMRPYWHTQQPLLLTAALIAHHAHYRPS